MKTRVAKWGNSLAVRIPHSVTKALPLLEGSSVDVSIENDEVVLRKTKVTLEDLLAQVKPEHLHDETDVGGPVGREEW